MDSLGLTGVDDITLDGVPLELWEMKARHSSRAADVSLEQEDHLRAVALAARKAEYQADDEARRKARHLEETPESVTIRRPFQTEHRCPTPEHIEFEEEKTPKTPPAPPAADPVAVGSPPPAENTEESSPEPPAADEPSVFVSSVATPPPAVLPADRSEGEGVIGWVQRRLSFKGDPTAAPMTERSPLPKPQQPQSSIQLLAEEGCPKEEKPSEESTPLSGDETSAGGESSKTDLPSPEPEPGRCSSPVPPLPPPSLSHSSFLSRRCGSWAHRLGPQTHVHLLCTTPGTCCCGTDRTSGAGHPCCPSTRV
jgi:hypothetical protein